MWMLILQDSTFDTILRDDSRTWVVKFAADWCPDCRRIKAAYAQFPDQFPSLSFADVDVDGNPELARRFDVRGIPTLLVFRAGQVVDRLFSRDAKTVKQVHDFVARQVRAAAPGPITSARDQGAVSE